jgi:hypothetical protein
MQWLKEVSMVLPKAEILGNGSAAHSQLVQLQVICDTVSESSGGLIQGLGKADKTCQKMMTQTSYAGHKGQ